MVSFDSGETPDVPDDLSGLFEPANFDDVVPSSWRDDESELGAPASDLDDVVSVLDNPDLVHARDPARLLWALATAGSQVRFAMSAGAQRWQPGDLGSDLVPRAVLVVTDASGSVAGPVLQHLGGGQSAVLDWRWAELPHWAGPADVMLAASVDGRHPRVATLLAEADRRGLTIVAVSPDDSPVAAAAGRGLRVPVEALDNRRAALWSLLTPLLLAGRALGVVRVSDDELAEVAAALDAVAEACRPATDAFSNAAKQLAVEITESELVVAGCGPMSSLAAQWMSASLGLMAGIGAVALSLPDDVAQAGALLEIAPTGPVVADRGDFFRDRIDEPGRRRRLLVLSEYGLAGDGLADRPEFRPPARSVSDRDDAGDFGDRWAESGRGTRSDSGRDWPDAGRHMPDAGRGARSDAGRDWPESGHNRPEATRGDRSGLGRDDRVAPPSSYNGLDLHDLAGARAAGALHDIAAARGIVSSTPILPGETPLARFAAATAFGDFVAAYAAIGRGVDPGADRAGELPY